MKNYLLLFVLLFSMNIFAQVEPPEGCDNDTIAPTFTLPYYLADSIYLDSASVPVLWNQAGTAISDIAFATLEDNCLSPEWPPWYGPTLTSGYLFCYPNCMTYTFTASDDAPNYNTQQITFHWLEDIVDDIQEYAIEPFSVYPNPCYGTFLANREYNIYDMIGRAVEQPLISGTYIVVSGSDVVQLIVR